MPYPFVTAVIAAAGSSSRMGGEKSKLLAPLGGKPVILHSMLALQGCPLVSEIIICARPGDADEFRSLAGQNGVNKLKRVVPGGATRQLSVFAAIAAADERAGYYCIHDGARPLATADLITRTIADAIKYGAAISASPVKDTVKIAGEGGFVSDTPDRDILWAAATPQVFERGLYENAMQSAAKTGLDATDDCRLAEAAGAKVYLSMGDYSNIKITTTEDLAAAKAILSGRDDGKKEGASMRIGQGYDVHRLVNGRRLILGGVDIPHEKGLLGHSDADVLTHAVTDALLGAAALGDIGGMFPDSDERYRDANSLALLAKAARRLRGEGFDIVNIDATLIAERPKIKPYIEEMRQNLARACGIDTGAVSVKATTEEGLGFTGSGEGMAATAIALAIRFL